MDRRFFLSIAGAAAVSATVPEMPAMAKNTSSPQRTKGAKGHFSLTQLASVTDTIGTLTF
jgi:hypothetical protein